MTILQSRKKIESFVRPSLVEIFPFARVSFDDSDFQDFYGKYCILIREFIIK